MKFLFLLCLPALSYGQPVRVIPVTDSTDPDYIQALQLDMDSKYSIYGGTIDGNSYVSNSFFVGVGSFTIQQNGNVGIGTTGPVATLEVDDIKGKGVQLRSYGTTGGLFIASHAKGTQASPTPLVNNDDVGSFIVGGYDSNGFTSNTGEIEFTATENYTPTAHGTQISLATTANGTTTLTDRVLIDQNGAVGIGTVSAPRSALDVYGNIFSTGVVFASGAGLTNIPSSALPSDVMYTDVGQVVSSTKTYTSSQTITASAFSVGISTFVVTGGNVGIGTTSPIQLLQIRGATNKNLMAYSSTGMILGAFDDAQNNNVQFNIAGSPILLNSISQGNVGIGTTNASQLFQIGNSTFSITSDGLTVESQYTKTQIQTKSPSVNGGKVICTNCAITNSECISTGTSVNQWQLMQATTITGCN